MLSWLRRSHTNRPNQQTNKKADAAAAESSCKQAGKNWRSATTTSFRKKALSPDVDDAACSPRSRIMRTTSAIVGGDAEDGHNHSVLSARSYAFRELAFATGSFSQENLIGEGGFGRVYRGFLGGKAVAVKQLDRTGFQGDREFLVEVLVLSGLLTHPNLVSLLGYCADGNQRLLVYNLMPLGSLDDHLFLAGGRREDRPPLPWRTRMTIAQGAAQGLEYLHETASPPVIYRDLKSSNILLDEGYHPRLSDFGLARLAPSGSYQEEDERSSKVMGTYGYCAPEYVRKGHLTVKSNVYSFGVVLLELITGKRVIDNTRPEGEQNLVAWAAPMFGEQRRFHELVDPLLLLRGEAPCGKELKQAVAVAAMCLQEEDTVRPLMSDVVMALSFLDDEAEAEATTTTMQSLLEYDYDSA